MGGGEPDSGQRETGCVVGVRRRLGELRVKAALPLFIIGSLRRVESGH